MYYVTAPDGICRRQFHDYENARLANHFNHQGQGTITVAIIFESLTTRPTSG